MTSIAAIRFGHMNIHETDKNSTTAADKQGLVPSLLGEKGLRELITRLKLPPQGEAFILRAAKGYVSRGVRCIGGNCVVAMPSVKMDSVAKLESRSHERAFAYFIEHDPKVLAYWEQPGHLGIRWKIPTGTTGMAIRPDFLVLEATRAILYEVKTREQLEEWAASKPHLIVWGTDGRFRSPPAESAAAALGFEYQIVSRGDIPAILLKNVIDLRRYIRSEGEFFPKELRQFVLDLVRNRPGISLEAARDEARGIEVVKWMLGRGDIYTDLHAFDVTDPGNCPLFIDAAAGKGFKRIPLLLDEICETRGSRVSPNSVLETAGWARISPVEQRRCTRKLHLIQNPIDAQNGFGSERSLRRWRALARVAQVSGLNPLLALARRPRAANGKEKDAKPDEFLKLAEDVITVFMARKDGFSVRAGYEEFEDACKKRELKPRSYNWFWKQVRRIPKYDYTLAREGSRAAYQYKPLRLSDDPSIQGLWPWHVVLIDHTQLDAEVTDRVTGLNLGRPWLTLAIDGYSRRILGFHLSFDSPSIDSIGGCLRMMVYLHGLLPEILSIDRGVDLQSNWLADLAAVYRIELHSRPCADPRFGGIVERLFNTQNQQLIHFLLGNTKLMKHPRMVAKGFRPSDNAPWNLPNLFELLAVYFLDVYDGTEHETLTVSPRQVYDQAISKEDPSKIRKVAYDADFYFVSLPFPVRPSVKITPGKGIRFRGLQYMHPAMHDGEVEGHKVYLRYDPSNLAVVYAYFNSRWHQCECTSSLFKAPGVVGPISESLLYGAKRKRFKNEKTHELLKGLRRSMLTAEKRLQSLRDAANQEVAPFAPVMREFWVGGRASEMLTRMIERSEERREAAKAEQKAVRKESALAKEAAAKPEAQAPQVPPAPLPDDSVRKAAADKPLNGIPPLSKEMKAAPETTSAGSIRSFMEDFRRAASPSDPNSGPS